MLVRKLTVVFDVLGELPQRVRHVPIGVLVDVRPVDTNDVK
ncbi:hypothetical protein OG468_35190 [Streptomyces zaomyceticus]|uniref:Uncharacterized protein n=2 Tax=Streptomyces zaomyceticus TaxID=68286 RepID=A0ABZ1L3E3_9ACTN